MWNRFTMTQNRVKISEKLSKIIENNQIMQNVVQKMGNYKKIQNSHVKSVHDDLKSKSH